MARISTVTAADADAGPILRLAYRSGARQLGKLAGRGPTA